MVIKFYKSRIDGRRFICERCHKSQLLRSYTLLQNTRFQLNQFYRIFLAFTQNLLQREAARFVLCNKRTVQDVYHYLREVIHWHIEHQNLNTTLGVVEGRLVTGVEIDESLFTHLNCIADKLSSQVWILGLIKRNSNRFVCRVIGNSQQRTGDTVLHIIQHFALLQISILMEVHCIDQFAVYKVMCITPLFMRMDMELEMILLIMWNPCGIE